MHDVLLMHLTCTSDAICSHTVKDLHVHTYTHCCSTLKAIHLHDVLPTVIHLHRLLCAGLCYRSPDLTLLPVCSKVLTLLAACSHVITWLHVCSHTSELTTGMHVCSFLSHTCITWVLHACQVSVHC